MEWLANPAAGFFIMLLASLFLFGELLVKAKGIFGLVGAGLMVFYFSYHLSEVTAAWTAAAFIVGLVLIVIDGKLVNDGTLAVIGLIVMVGSVALPAPGWVYGFMAGSGLVLGAGASLAFLKIFPHRELWQKVTLRDRLTGETGYNSINQGYRGLIGKEGVTKTPFHPVGTIEIDGQSYSAVTDGKWLEAGREIEVVSVDGTKIVVTAAERKAGDELND
ncbi:NfeD family protein [Bacillus marinisedimentorum]|uniref:NfeD family protein n=1 Tax=Bacillus marinisedimentorum TaxID=1821260 RepID=UPI0008732B21|nr:NfeD family protein [Bacillus marinisedimentorum]